ncbi:MAG: GTP-binding protein [Egibacteraceae bacterium]
MLQRPARPRATVRRSGSFRQVKVVVTGPFDAGKTTLIKTISEIAVLSTERRVSDHTAALKSDTTVAMDFGRLTVDRDLVIHLFGTPGQQRFDFMWEILSEGMLGFIVLVDPHREDSLAEAASILDFFRQTARVPYVVGVNKSDDDPGGGVAQVTERLDLPSSVRAVACNALDRGSIKDLLLELLYAVLDEVDAHHHAAV